MERQIAAHLTDRPPLPSAAGLPPAFDTVIAKGMAKKPDERYSSAGELATAAQQALLPPTVAAVNDTPNRKHAGTAVAALIFALVGGSAFALTRDGTAIVTDAPEPPAPPSVSATAVPGQPVAEPSAAPAPRHPGPAPETAPKAITTNPAAPPALPGTAVAENVPVSPPGGPTAEPHPVPPPAPPPPTTSVAAPPTTTITPTSPSTTPTTPATPTSEPTTTTPTSTTPATTPPETTGSGEPTESAAAPGSATAERADNEGSTIATSPAPTSTG